MGIFWWWRLRRTKPKTTRVTGPFRHRLAFERLEHRCLLSSGFDSPLFISSALEFPTVASGTESITLLNVNRPLPDNTAEVPAIGRVIYSLDGEQTVGELTSGEATLPSGIAAGPVLTGLEEAEAANPAELSDPTDAGSPAAGDRTPDDTDASPMAEPVAVQVPPAPGGDVPGLTSADATGNAAQGAGTNPPPADPAGEAGQTDNPADQVDSGSPIEDQFSDPGAGVRSNPDSPVTESTGIDSTAGTTASTDAGTLGGDGASNDTHQAPVADGITPDDPLGTEEDTGVAPNNGGTADPQPSPVTAGTDQGDTTDQAGAGGHGTDLLGNTGAEHGTGGLSGDGTSDSMLQAPQPGTDGAGSDSPTHAVNQGDSSNPLAGGGDRGDAPQNGSSQTVDEGSQSALDDVPQDSMVVIAEASGTGAGASEPVTGSVTYCSPLTDATSPEPGNLALPLEICGTGYPSRAPVKPRTPDISGLAQRDGVLISAADAGINGLAEGQASPLGTREGSPSNLLESAHPAAGPEALRRLVTSSPVTAATWGQLNQAFTAIPPTGTSPRVFAGRPSPSTRYGMFALATPLAAAGASAEAGTEAAAAPLILPGVQPAPDASGSPSLVDRSGWWGFVSQFLLTPQFSNHPQPTVMLAIGDGDARDAMNVALVNAGYMVLPAPTARDAINVLRTPLSPIDVAVLDLQLPDVSGVQVFSRLRELYPRLPVMCYVDHADAEDLARLRQQGVRHFFQKPVVMDELLATLKALVA